MDHRQFLKAAGMAGAGLVIAGCIDKLGNASQVGLCQSLLYPERYREEFMAIWEQWKDTTRPEGPLWWTCQVFGEYVHPGWTYTPEENEIQERQRDERIRERG